jgi:hypothetical protein
VAQGVQTPVLPKKKKRERRKEMLILFATAG